MCHPRCRHAPAAISTAIKISEVFVVNFPTPCVAIHALDLRLEEVVPLYGLQAYDPWMSW